MQTHRSSAEILQCLIIFNDPKPQSERVEHLQLRYDRKDQVFGDAVAEAAYACGFARCADEDRDVSARVTGSRSRQSQRERGGRPRIRLNRNRVASADRQQSSREQLHNERPGQIRVT